MQSKFNTERGRGNTGRDPVKENQLRKCLPSGETMGPRYNKNTVKMKTLNIRNLNYPDIQKSNQICLVIYIHK